MDVKNRTLFFGDNLNILKEKIPDDFFDLIYLDPPFNSNRSYNVLFKEGLVDSSAQIHAFLDTWEWTSTTLDLFNQLKKSANPKIAILINSLFEVFRDTPMMAYLVNMTARLIPLHRVLKKTGSIYLHCDPAASHYLKLLMDTIFGVKNFINEVVWSYGARATVRKSGFPQKHDIILFYSKSQNYHFSPLYTGKYKDPDLKRYNKVDEQGKRYALIKRIRSKTGEVYYGKTYPKGEGAPMTDVWDIPTMASTSSERIGYPTQKPEKLLERIISASSDKGDWVLDPFCGCGTTVAVAEKLHRNWVGIDISMQAVNIINQRMENHFPKIDINIDGIPMDFEGAVKLAERDKFAFQDWAISLIKARPPSGESKRGADKGIDGIILYYERMALGNPKLRKIIIQVKGGATGRGDVAKLKGDIERENAPMGILITLREPSKEMKRETSLAGKYKYSDTTSFPKIQILSIKDWFKGKKPELPTDIVNPFKKAKEKGDQKALF